VAVSVICRKKSLGFVARKRRRFIVAMACARISLGRSMNIRQCDLPMAAVVVEELEEGDRFGRWKPVRLIRARELTFGSLECFSSVVGEPSK